MKVLIINLRIGTGSVGRIVSDLYHGIVENGDECKVAYARGNIGSVPLEDTIRICSEWEVKKHALLTRLFGNTAFYSKSSTKKFIKIIKQYNPDIVHLHGTYGYYINMEVLFRYLEESGVRVVSTLHSCWDFTGHCCYFDYVGCNNWMTGCKKCVQKSSYPRSSFLDNTARNFERKKELYGRLNNCVIVTPSKWLADLVEKTFLAKHEICVINNGIDTEVFKPTEYCGKYNLPCDRPIILCVANIWERRKGWEDVVELSNILDDNIQLVVVGVSDSQKEQLAMNTIGISRTENAKELAELYSIASVFFNPTYEDNYPTVNLEALACGTPVITYNTGGSTEMLNDESGIVIKRRDYNAIFNYLNERKNTRVSAKVIKKCDRRNMVLEYIKLYESFMRKKRDE